MEPPSHESRVTSHETSSLDSRVTFWVVSAVLTTVYVLTLAPDVTLWDAGEFQAAVASLGIPHPPGTPLYIVLGNVWTRTLGFLPPAVALNLMSAAATAIACGLLGKLVTKWMNGSGRVTHHESRVAGIAAGLSSGTMLAVWQNATEAEVYALSLLLGVLMIVVGEEAGTRDSLRHRVLLAYLMGLAIPVQISALVLAPAAIYLASTGVPDGRIRWRVVFALGSVLMVVVAFSQGSALLASIGIFIGMATALGRGVRRPARVAPAALAIATIVGLSATLFMLVRAPHDPFINQGNPETIDAMMDVVTRQQYPLPGMWPRRASPWIQLLNMLQYSDWQVASGVDASVAASWWRTPLSLGALILFVAGARSHWARDRRSARGTALLVFGGTLGVVAVLNLSAGPSILDTVLPPGARHEPRERDYFFAWGFAGAGIWMGLGAIVAARRVVSSRRPALVIPMALGLAALPAALNWRAATRRPDANVAPVFADAILRSAPPRSVIFMAGDNDTYTVWYRQAVLGERRDVVPVTISLLGAQWYREEMARRHGLLDAATVKAWRGETETLRAIVARATRVGRPVTVSMSVSPDVRSSLAQSWVLTGLAYLAAPDTAPAITVDTARTRVVADLVDGISGSPAGRDPAVGYVSRLFRCPSAILQLGSTAGSRDAGELLDSRCNFK